MRLSLALVAALLGLPILLHAQQPTSSAPPRDTTHRDSTWRGGARAAAGSARPHRLAEVTITATPHRRIEASSAVTVPAVVLRQAPAATPYELLRQTAGLEVHEQGQGPGFASDASVRGFSSDHSTDIALWIDGVPNNEPVNGHAEGYNDWSLLMPETIRDVDVLKGPTSALFGNFALAGVVNVRTLARARGTSAWLTGGSYGRAEGGVLTGWDHAGSGAAFALRGVRDDGWRPNSRYALGNAQARIEQALGTRADLDAGVRLYASDWDSPGFLTAEQFAARDYDVVADPTDGGRKRHAQERASLAVTLSPALLWRSTAYATQGRWTLFLTVPPEPGAGEGSGGQTEEEDRRYGFGATSALTWGTGSTEATIGVEGRWDHADYERWLVTHRVRDSAATLVGASQGSGALFVQAAADVGARLRLSAGVRAEDVGTASRPRDAAAASDTHGILAPKLGALLRVRGPLALYANASRGFRSTDGVITDPTLPFITVWAYESGVKVDERRLTASVALFRMDVSNEQTFDPITARSTSGGASRRQGVELGARAELAHGVALFGDVTFNDARYRRLVTADGDTLSGARVFNTARYVGSAGVDVAAPDQRWRLRLAANGVGPYTPFDEPDVLLSPYALLHASGSVRVGRATLELGVRNLLDRAYPELRAGGFVAPGQPRTLFATVRVGAS